MDIEVNLPISEEKNSYELPPFNLEENACILVLGTGPNTQKYESEIIEFIKKRQPIVLECNPSHNRFEVVSEQYYRSILNWVRLKKLLESDPVASNITTFTGISSIPSSYANIMDLKKVPCNVSKKEVVIQEQGISIPEYVVGMFTIAVALRASPQEIFLAGFDGYPKNKEQNKVMDSFLEQIKDISSPVSILPTVYRVKIQPIYELLQ